MDINGLKDFQLVAAYGGFGKASRATGRSKATLSRRVASLEETLGIRLIERGAHAMEVTEAGQLLLARTEGPMHEVAEAVAAARDGLLAPRGRLRIAAPLLFSQMAMGRLAADFVALFPDVQLDCVSEDRVVNLVDEHFDVAIRINPDKDSSLVGRCFVKDRMLVAAAPSVPLPTRRSGQPLRAPAVVVPNFRYGDLWTLDNGKLVIEPQPVLCLSTFLMVRDAIAAEAGLALVPESIIGSHLRSGELLKWGVVGEEVELWVLHTSRRLQSPKVRAFVDFICDAYSSGSFVLGP